MCRGFFLGLVWMMALGRVGGTSPDDRTPITADAIVEQWIARIRNASQRASSTEITCRRLTSMETLDRQGELRERQVKEHRVRFQGLTHHAELVTVNGEPPTAERRKAEQERESEQQRRYTERQTGPGMEYLDEALLRKFQYALEGEEDLGGRRVYRLRFTAADDSPNARLADRVIRRMSGRLWIDAEEAELVRLEARLADRLTLGGIVAALDRLDLTLERRRLTEGQWFNTALRAEAAGRKVFNRFHGRLQVDQTDFEPVAAPAIDP